MLFVETPTNPVMRLTDLRAAADARAPPRRAAGRRQHVRQPVHPAADRVRRRPRHAQHDEVPQRPQRQRRRHRRRGARRRHRVAAVRAERRGRDPRARSTRGSCCAAPRRCRCAWQQHNANGLALARVPRRAPEGAARLLSRACRRIRSTSWRSGRCAASAACSRSSSARSRRRGGCSNARPAACARRKPRRRRDADLASGDDDPRLGAGRSGARRSASPTAWCASRPASRTSTT